MECRHRENAPQRRVVKEKDQMAMSCLRGRHRWKQAKPDSLALLRGEVVLRQQCERCGKERNRAR